MRFATVTANGTQLYGVERDDGFVALSPDFRQWKTLRNVIGGGAGAGDAGTGDSLADKFGTS